MRLLIPKFVIVCITWKHYNISTYGFTGSRCMPRVREGVVRGPGGSIRSIAIFVLGFKASGIDGKVLDFSEFSGMRASCGVKAGGGCRED